MSDKLHNIVKHYLVDQNKSLQQYIIELIKKDLNFSDDKDDLSDYTKTKK